MKANLALSLGTQQWASMQETFGHWLLAPDTLCGTKLDSSVKAKPFSTLHWHNPELIWRVHGFPSHVQASSIDLLDPVSFLALTL